MKLKDLFKSTKTVSSSSLDELASELESQEYIESYNKDKIRFLPNVDYSDPKNFAFFGSAEKYYTDAFVRIRNTFPYDGSEREKYDWLNESTFLDLHIYENIYPRFNGFANMGYPTWGTRQGSLTSDGYGQSDKNTFIKTFGGPNESGKSGLKKQFPDANILDSTKTRESNLRFKLEDGVTLEMWVKKPAFDTSKTEKEVLFDLWNGEASGSAQYGRLRLELTGAASGSPFLLTALSGTAGTLKGTQNYSLGTNLTKASITDWTHVALTLKNSGSDIQTNLYINGAFNQRQTISNAAMGEVTGSLISYIGALQTSPSGSTATEGFGKFSGSIDEFRYWKAERTSKEIGRQYWTHIGGGTNSDDANTNLGVYYKFNEGITANSVIDSNVLDYSGRVSNGAWTGYVAGARSTGSAIVLSNASPEEYKDPTIYSSHPDYISTLQVLEASGSIHDIANNSSLFNSMPSWILEEDDTKEGNLRNLTQAMASYFDNAYLYIQEINSLKDVYAHFQTNIIEAQEINNASTTSITGSVKPLPFADRLLTNAAFVAPELFADATILEALADRSEDEHYEMKIHNVKNQIYQNVYSCLTKIYKEKGTKKGFRNVLHSFGIDEDVVKINFYGDNVDFEIGDKHNIRARKEKFVDFNHPDRFAGSIYQYASGTDGVSFISGSEGDLEKYIPVTFETQVILPNKIPFNEPYGFETTHTKSVIAGIHRANPADGTDYVIPSPDYCQMQLFTVRNERESKYVRFHLSSSALNVHVSSSLYPDQYLNNEWYLAFKIKNDRHPTPNEILSSSSDPQSYTIDFIGYNTEANTVLNSFHFSESIDKTKAENFLNHSKRIYAGAKRTNFTGGLEERTDHKIGYVRFWMSELSKDVMLRHANDSTNYGSDAPFRSAYLMQSDVNHIKIPQIDTLLLHWDFEKLNTSDTSGQFLSLDVTSGSGESRYVPEFESLKRKFYHGRGDFFLANDEKVIDVEYINAARITSPEHMTGDDMIEIRTQDDLLFTRNTLPQDYFIAFEKSMSQTISEEMINFMSSITAFNELIGRPVDRYRMEYKDLSKLRQLFFERISNEPDLDKYIDYYKWLDDALGEMLVALVPASIKHSDGVNNVIENHIFDRDKYTNKFPTIEFVAPEPEGGMNTINRHLYPWKTGHAPSPLEEDDNCFWWLERAERDQPPLSQSLSGNNETRVKVFQARNSVLNRSFTTAQHFAVDRQRHLHGGTNYEPNKRRDYIWSAARDASESPIDYGKFGGFPLRYVLVNNDMLMALKDCDDERPVTEKLKRAFGAIDGFDMFHHYFSGGDDGLKKGSMVVPFNIMSSSVTTGYTGRVEGIPGFANNIDIVNLHSDTVDNSNAIPMQSPFTERWVGGHQSRHAPINMGNDATSSRGEGYKILINHIENVSGSLGIAGPDYPHPYSSRTEVPHMYLPQAKARYFREERAKRPLNTRNILTSGSQVGNYIRNYQVVHTFGRYVQKSMLNDLPENAQLHNPTNATLPQTTQEASLIARDTGSAGNTMSNFNNSNLYLRDVKESDAANPNQNGKSIIVNKFSAPGGFETMSEIFLDLYSKEKSSYNALPFRNLQVRGSGSGEANTVRLIDIHGNRYGLLTHLTRHSAQFGIDSNILAADSNTTSASFHKVNRNPKWAPDSQDYDYDNYWHQHHIPQSDFQYKWVKDSHTASYATSSLQGHILSNFTEPSGTTSRYPHEHIENIVHSQSGLNIDASGNPIGFVPPLSGTRDQTLYGYPSWEQIRNNDRNVNVRLKKAYGFNYDDEFNMGLQEPSGSMLSKVQTLDESRAIENIPNTVNFAFYGSRMQFQYPFVNMKYHFNNAEIRQEYRPTNNETMYDSLYGFYSTREHDQMFVTHKNIKQILYPQFVKHTKFFVRHRHFYASHFWTDGENDLYQKDINETGSYYRVDEVGRRETPVTATLWREEDLSTSTINFIKSGELTNIIPSQSIWSMDSRTNFTTSDHHVAASNSAGAVGVLQNQDHHFHNGIGTFLLLQSGSAASGTFKVKGATRFGTAASGSFRVQGVIPTGINASGSFDVGGKNVPATAGTGQFTAVGAYQAPVNAQFKFTAVGRTVLGTHPSASFEVEGVEDPAEKANGSFLVTDTRQFTDSTTAQTQFALKAMNSPDFLPEATFTIKSIPFPGTVTNSTFTLDGYQDPGYTGKTLTIRLHMGGGNNIYNQQPTVLWTPGTTIAENQYVEIQISNDFGTSVPTVSQVSSANSNDNYSVSQVSIAKIKPSQFSSDASFWLHLRNLIEHTKFAGMRTFDCSVITTGAQAGTFSVSTKSFNTGRGNTHFITEHSDGGSVMTAPNNNGGVVGGGVEDQDHIVIPYWETSGNLFKTLRFEVDTSTGANPVLNLGQGIALPGASSSAQPWQSITITDDTSYFNAIKSILENPGSNGGSFGDNYDISYVTSGTNPYMEATFKLKLKSSIITTANAADNTINSQSWDNRNLTGTENVLPNVDFNTYQAGGGSTFGDKVSFNLNGTVKEIEIFNGSTNTVGNTIKVDARSSTHGNNTNFYNTIETQIQSVLPSGFTVSKSHTVGNVSDPTDDTCAFTIQKSVAGAYQFNTQVQAPGASFGSVVNTDGTDAFGFGSTGIQNANKLVIGGVDVVRAHQNSNSGINVKRNQSQANIVNNIISSIQSGAPGNAYNITTQVVGNGHRFNLEAISAGAAGNNTMTGVGQFSPDGPLAGGADAAGSVNGHTLTLGGKTIILDNSSPYTNTGNNVRVQIDGIDNATMWADLESQINSETVFTVVSTASGTGGKRRFNLRHDNIGAAGNSVTVASSDSSFNVIQTPTGGTDETGANDYDETNDEISIAVYDTNISGVHKFIKIRADKDNTHSSQNSDGYSLSTVGNTTTVYVDSTRSSNQDFWNAIEAAIETQNDGSGNNLVVTQNSANPREFTVTSYFEGARGNHPGAGSSGTSITSGATFQNASGHLDGKFKNGVNSSGAGAGDTITIHGQTITVLHSAGANAASREVNGSAGVSDSDFWTAIEGVIDNHIDDVSASRSSGVFTVTTTGTGASQNPDISGETGNTFTINNAGTNGTNESGARAGDTITIDGTTFEVYTAANAGGVGGGNIGVAAGIGVADDAAFHANLRNAIINPSNTDFGTVSIGSKSGDFYKFSLTSSVSGTAENVTFTTNNGGSPPTFKNLVGAAGGTDTFGLQHLDKIIFSASSDGAGGVVGDAPANQITFAIDTGNNTNQPNPHANTPIYNIGIGDLITAGSNDNTRSQTAWNRIKDEIILRTNFDTINIETFFDTSDGENHAIFHITSSETGSAYNTEIIQTVTASNDGKDGFTIVAQTAGGVDESGATAGDELQIVNHLPSSKVYTIRNDSSLAAGGLEINAGTQASPLTDTQFFNNITASIIAQQDYDIISYTVNSNTGTFEFTASNGTADPFMAGCASQGHPANCQLLLTGTAYNGSMAKGGNTFSDLGGPSGGVDGIHNIVRFQEIIPQPRYMYPHVVVSPGSVRCPTDKSNLGVISDLVTPYKLRSNHYQLTRSLGYHSDGLFDNTSRWTTPDLSGLTPFDEDYDHYYERIRGLNHHHSLVPEFRISSHVKGILGSGQDETDYFTSHYWLELTGASLDHGEHVATNEDFPVYNPANLPQFLNEFATTSKIKNMKSFIEDNVDGHGLTPVSVTLTCEAIKSFLPYEGFYPQTRTVQMCAAFASSYARNIQAAEADPNDPNLDFPDNNVLAQTRPVFDLMMSPGLLYNTIKSGIAVDYPIVQSKMATASIKDPYGGTNFMITNEYFEERVPFEALMDPRRHINKQWIVDMNPHPSSSFNLKARLGAEIDEDYKLMANNFFAESMEFFLEKGQPSRIISKPESDPNFGVVTAISEKDGIFPVYRSIFKVYKSKKQHPFLEASGSEQVISMSVDSSGTIDRIYNRPPSGSNYFEADYCGTTGADLEYEPAEYDYPRPNYNPYAEVGTITMYSQPNAFGPPCAGGVSVRFTGIPSSGDDTISALTADDNNTTYMMYDSTNGYNAPFTPPYYDGEGWAIYTFTPDRAGKHTLDEILAKTTVEFLRYEVNHESGSFGDRGTFGPQGFTLNDNAMQADASFNLFKKATVNPFSSARGGNTITLQEGGGGSAGSLQPVRGNVWVIESKYETPILNFAKYLNREYNAEFEADTNTNDIYTSKISLSGTRHEPDTLSAVNPHLASVHKLSGVLNPIGMWHQFGEYPKQADVGIFMQIDDIPDDYIARGTEMTIPNPKYAAVAPDVGACDGANAGAVYNTSQNVRARLLPYVDRQINKRRLIGEGEFSVEGGAIQVLNAEDDIILDTELRYEELQSLFGVTLNDTSQFTENFKFFHVFRDTDSTTGMTKRTLTVAGSFNDGTSGSPLDFTQGPIKVFIDNADKSADYNASSQSTFKGHWAASYYNYDRHDNYAPLMIVTRNLKSLSYDFGEYSGGFWEEFLKDFSIGIEYDKQSLRFADAEEVDCIDSSISTRDAVFAPAYVAKFVDVKNSALKAGSLSKIDLSQGGIAKILETKPVLSQIATPIINAESKLVNSAIKKARKVSTTFKAIRSSRKLRLIPPCPGVPGPPANSNAIGALTCGAAVSTAGTSNYVFPEPQFVRGSIRFNAGDAIKANVSDLLARSNIRQMPQYAPQNDGNITGRAATIRWGKFMPVPRDIKINKSLADLVGFTREPVKMGKTAKQKIIREAIVAIPYLARTGESGFLKLDQFMVNKYLFQQGLISEDREALPEGAAISQEQVDARNGEIELDPAVVRQIEQMQKYVFPPHIDFINYDVAPVPMYIFEYEMKLERDDLVSIWQGVATDNMKRVEFDTKSVSHVLSEESLLGAIKQETDNMMGLKDIKWRVFKVKQKAANDYEFKMAMDMIELGFVPRFEAGEKLNKPPFGYNWPYDYFSLVENAQIKVDVQLQKPIQMDMVVPGDGGGGGGIQPEEEVYVGVGVAEGLGITTNPGLDALDDSDADSSARLEADTALVVGLGDEVRTGSTVIDVVLGGTGTTTSSCVLAGTKIHTERGVVPVESITETDRVLSYDFEKNEFGHYDILSIMTPVVRNRWARLETSMGHVLECTEEHPLYTLLTDNNEMPVNQSVVGDSVYIYQNGEMTQDQISSIRFIDKDVTVYNFEVDVVHSYLSNNILSHNKQTGTSGGSIDTDLDTDTTTTAETVGESAETVRVTTTTTVGGSGRSGGSY